MENWPKQLKATYLVCDQAPKSLNRTNVTQENNIIATNKIIIKAKKKKTIQLIDILF